MLWPGYAFRGILTGSFRPSQLLLTVAYLVTGKLALLLALPPGYA